MRGEWKMHFHQVKLAALATLLLLAGCGLRGGAEGPLLNEIAGMMKPGDGVYLELQGGVLHATGTRYPIRGDTFEIPLKEVTIHGGPSNIGPQLDFRCKGFRECIVSTDKPSSLLRKSRKSVTSFRSFHISNPDDAAKIASKLRELAAHKTAAVSGDWYAKKAEVQAEAHRKSAETRAYWAERSGTGGGSRSSGSGGLFKATEGLKTLERIRRKRREQERENARIREENRRRQAEHRRRQEEARKREEARKKEQEARRQAEYRRRQEENRRHQEEARRERQARLREEAGRREEMAAKRRAERLSRQQARTQTTWRPKQALNADSSHCLKKKRLKGGFNVADNEITNTCSYTIEVRGVCLGGSPFKANYPFKGAYTSPGGWGKTLRPNRWEPDPNMDICHNRGQTARLIACKAPFTPQFLSSNGSTYGCFE